MQFVPFILIGLLIWFVYVFSRQIFTTVIVTTCIVLAYKMMQFAFDKYALLTGQPKSRDDVQSGDYESALYDLSQIPRSEGNSRDWALATHLNSLRQKVAQENWELEQRVARLKEQVLNNIASTGNLEDRLRVARGTHQFDHEKRLVEQLNRHYGIGS